MTVSGILSTIRESVEDHYEVRSLAEEICAGLGSKDYLSEILAIFHYCVVRTRYSRDPHRVELVRAPYKLVQQIRRGQRPSVDCDDLTGLINALCESMGFSSRVITVAFKNIFRRGVRQYTHVFGDVQEPVTGKWIVCDAVPLQTGQMLGRVRAAKIWTV